MSKEDAGWKEVFGVSDKDLEEAMRGPKSTPSADSDAVLQMLAEIMRRSGAHLPSQN